jgi:hypothetical protein
MGGIGMLYPVRIADRFRKQSSEQLVTMAGAIITRLTEPGKRFSRLEAWLYIMNVLATGADDQSARLKRGEFVANIRQARRMFQLEHRRRASVPRNTLTKLNDYAGGTLSGTPDGTGGGTL